MRAIALVVACLLPGWACADARGGGDAPAHAWELAWHDEFDGDAIDPAKWALEDNCWGGGNAESQCYTPRKDGDPHANAFVRDGLLHIVARRERHTGPASPDHADRRSATLPYTSARLRTKHAQSWTFGRFEVRAKLPRGQGSWPAAWMLPTDSPYGTWAASGEIDIVEAVNLGTPSDAPGAAAGTPETRVHGTLHYGRPTPGNVHTTASYTLPGGANPADDFHVYAVEWEDGEIRWFVDDVHYATQTADGWYSQSRDAHGDWVDAPAGAPFDGASRYHLLLNLAVGGNWAGKANRGGIDRAAYPQTLLVDYVRVYRCLSLPATGRGCGRAGDRATHVAPTQRRPPLPAR